MKHPYKNFNLFKLFIFTIAFVFSSITLAKSHNHKPSTIKISKNSIVAIHLLDLKDGKNSAFQLHYYPLLKKAIKKSGGNLEAKFDTYQIAEGKLRPHYIIMTEWPSVAAFEAYLRTSQIEPYATAQRNITRHSEFSLYTIDNDISFRPNNSSAYEFWFLSYSSPQSPDLMYQSYIKVLPSMTSYGRELLIDLKPLNHPQSNHKRDLAGLSIWPSPSHFYKFITEDLVAEAFKVYRDPAVRDIEIINTQFVE
ncbi:DUF1330 domain-containing protein [Cellvibrio japonicus]|uniref:Uncharacterized protein n=1 Tax=Cellvibrio japonicus (strain Ueda107) TaxID=498211 RepID=B3PDZ9_CELJU|nr:DUF1330 domain-containing protein [Cellvibrio japonicus]ACE86171.1 hypothetical protein CJA_3202 [Cellvibrio japonicus Ueda107]QEI13483.1 DUF1330 domain-containing protein [Cellvibrio japonicus]QEI17057.1 DUF1330 domain-containing protein [Cellvibrio japonicus]QEI20635.1 DUF1330 domain-containing protein [Cellvibrio japonicus]